MHGEKKESIMADPLAQAILCPILLGRDAQVAALTRLLDQARTGQGNIVLISGEAGIGNRSVAEARRLAAERHFTIWQGSCYEQERISPMPRCSISCSESWTRPRFLPSCRHLYRDKRQPMPSRTKPSGGSLRR
ncbi:MAG: ATP-binding protein [Caldilineaceae bacterium]